MRLSQTEQTAAETDNRLKSELLQVTKERDEALKNLLMTRQLSQYFQHREEVCDQTLLD